MKVFYDTRYRFYNRQIKQPLTFLLLSDIHFAPKVTSDILDKLVAYTKSKKPDYILIPGDLVDHLDTIKTKAAMRRLTSWIEQLSKVAPTIISLGNHDYYHIDHERQPKFFGRYHWIAEHPDALIEKLSSIENVHVLDNSTYEDENIYVLGFTQSPEYYGTKFLGEDANETNIEDHNIMLHDLRNLPTELLHNLPEKKAKIALVHSPFRLFDADIAKEFDAFDHVISGHTHNGAVPPVIDDFWRSDRGLAAPGNRQILPEHARAGLHDAAHKFIICGAVTTISDSARKLKFLNAAFPINVATLELTHDIAYARKPNIKHKYLNPNQF